MIFKRVTQEVRNGNNCQNPTQERRRFQSDHPGPHRTPDQVQDFHPEPGRLSVAKRIEGDQEKIASLGAPGAGIRVKQLVLEYEEQWSAKDKSTLPRVR